LTSVKGAIPAIFILAMDCSTVALGIELIIGRINIEIKEDVMFFRNSLVLDSRIVWSVLMLFALLSLLPAQSRAALLESRLADGAVASERLQQIDAIRLALEKEVVAQRLADYGLSAEQIMAKLPTMSDEQLHQLAGLSNTLGEGGGLLEGIIGLLLIVLLVILILKVSNKQVIIR
jgi:hypothetical protein